MTLAFNEQWHYALDITDESDASTYISERTLRTYRKILIDEGLDRILFETLTYTLVKALVGSEFCDRYLGKESEGCFSQVKPSEASRTLDELADDLLYLVELFSSYDPVKAFPEYKLLTRVLHDQCLITDTGTDTQVALKPPKEVSPDSLQNPSDPNAGYDSHKGQGYKAQIMETYHDEKQDDTKPNLITYADVEPAHEHDANALQPAIDAAQERDCCPEELTCRNRMPESTRYGLSALRCHPQGARIEHHEVRRSTLCPFVPLFYANSGH